MGGLVSDVDWHANVHALSGGQKRRVALAKLLIEDHDVIMLDAYFTDAETNQGGNSWWSSGGEKAKLAFTILVAAIIAYLSPQLRTYGRL